MAANNRNKPINRPSSESDYSLVEGSWGVSSSGYAGFFSGSAHSMLRWKKQSSQRGFRVARGFGTRDADATAGDGGSTRTTTRPSCDIDAAMSRPAGGCFSQIARRFVAALLPTLDAARRSRAVSG